MVKSTPNCKKKKFGERKESETRNSTFIRGIQKLDREIFMIYYTQKRKLPLYTRGIQKNKKLYLYKRYTK